jgi:uncharacterized protein YdaU (DUF1376 family)
MRRGNDAARIVELTRFLRRSGDHFAGKRYERRRKALRDRHADAAGDAGERTAEIRQAALVVLCQAACRSAKKTVVSN